MSIVLAAINASYSHTNLAVRTIKAYAEARGVTGVTIYERTINHREDILLRELINLSSKEIYFSIYLWNVGTVCRLAEQIRLLRPNVRLVAGGPEASYHCDEFLLAHPCFDCIIAGEGEAAFLDVVWHPGRTGVIWQEHPTDLNDLVFPYQDLDRLQGRTLYYESMRGCPFRCAYCLSSIDRAPVRYRSLPQVYSDLRRFLEAGVRQVKFVDRTFNCDGPRATEIWRWIQDNDNGVTGFHFELAGELVSDEMVELLSTFRPGLVQFEIGVQTANPETLAAIHRPNRLGQLFRQVEKLRKPGNIHLHLDLIAGLPLEGYDSFGLSFDTVFARRPHQLQLGFLKVLKGSAMEAMAPAHGILYRSHPPYEVLQTNCLSYEELAKLHSVEEVVEKYYNSGRFRYLVNDLLDEFPHPFAFFEALGAFYTEQGHDLVPPSKTGYYQILGDFMSELGILRTERRQWLCRYDMALHEKPRKVPAWVRVDGSAPNRDRILAVLRDRDFVERMFPQHREDDAKYMVKVLHAEVFPFDPATGRKGERLVLFDYTRRTVDGRAKTVRISPESVENRPGMV